MIYSLRYRRRTKTLEHFGGKPVELATYRREFRIPVIQFYGPRIPGYSMEEIDEYFFSVYRRRLEEIAFFEGAEDLLLLARRRGCSLFLLTTIPADIVREYLQRRGHADTFQAIYGSASDKRKLLPRILAEHQLQRDQTLYVGDTPHDVEAGRLARVRAGASTYGYSDVADLQAAQPDYCFHSIADLTTELDREYLLATTPLVIPTVGGIIDDGEGRILLVRTRKWSNLFGIPGGKIHYGETMQAAYEREILEECGLSLRDTNLVTVQDCIESSEFYEKRHFLLINYYSRAVNPEALSINYEIEETRWSMPGDALDLPLNAPTRSVIIQAARQGFIDVGGESE